MFSSIGLPFQFFSGIIKGQYMEFLALLSGSSVCTLLRQEAKNLCRNKHRGQCFIPADESPRQEWFWFHFFPAPTLHFSWKQLILLHPVKITHHRWTGDLGLIPGLGRAPGEEKGYPLQYSGLENSKDCTVYWVTKSEIFHCLPGQ